VEPALDLVEELTEGARLVAHLDRRVKALRSLAGDGRPWYLPASPRWRGPPGGPTRSNIATPVRG
jgi:hypothetical protein